jgi:hypothetical protein
MKMKRNRVTTQTRGTKFVDVTDARISSPNFISAEADATSSLEWCTFLSRPPTVADNIFPPYAVSLSIMSVRGYLMVVYMML